MGDRPPDVGAARGAGLPFAIRVTEHASHDRTGVNGAMEIDRRSALARMLATVAIAPIGIPRAAGMEPAVRFLDPAGDDDADGLTPQTAWHSLDAIASLGANGAVVLLRRGGLWHGTARLAGAVTLGAYGEGPRPIILGSLPVSGLVRTGSAAKTTLWEVPVRKEPFQIHLAGGRARRVAGKDDLVAPMQWHWGDGRLTVAWSEERPPVVEAGVQRAGLQLDGGSEVCIRSIDLRHAVYGVDADRAMSCTIDDCWFGGCYGSAVRASSAERRSLLAVRGCRAEDTGGVGIAFGGRIDRVLVDGNVVRRAGQLTAEAVGSSGHEAAFGWTAGIKNWGWGEAGWQGEVAITRNLVEACGPESGPATPTHGIGIWIDEVVAPRTRHTVAWNRVRVCASRGIYVEKSDDVDVDYNHVQDCATVEGTGSLALQANMYGYDVVADAPAMIPRDCRGNRIRHNTVVGGRLSLEAYARDPECRMIGNLVEDNIMVSRDGETVAGARLAIRGGAANDQVNGHGNVYRQNGLGPRAGQRLEWNGHVASGTPAALRWSDGSFSAIPDADPQFVDAAKGDVRLRATSPCRNAALGRSRNTDLAGRPIPEEGPADLGCLQYANPEPVRNGRLESANPE